MNTPQTLQAIYTPLTPYTRENSDVILVPLPTTEQQSFFQKKCCGLQGRAIAAFVLGAVVGIAATAIALYALQQFNVSGSELAMRFGMGALSGAILFLGMERLSRCCNCCKSCRKVQDQQRQLLQTPEDPDSQVSTPVSYSHHHRTGVLPDSDSKRIEKGSPHDPQQTGSPAMPLHAFNFSDIEVSPAKTPDAQASPPPSPGNFERWLLEHPQQQTQLPTTQSTTVQPSALTAAVDQYKKQLHTNNGANDSDEEV